MRHCIFPSQVILITTPSIMYLGYAMHRIARSVDDDYKPRHRRRAPAVSRGNHLRDFEEMDETGEEVKPDFFPISSTVCWTSIGSELVLVTLPGVDKM